MKYSPAELSYLKKSLIQSPPIRPDARLTFEFRPIEAVTSVLPSTNGSARVKSSDGGECLIGVKAKVVRNSKIGLSSENGTDASCSSGGSPLIKVAVDISGSKEDDPTAVVLSSMLSQVLGSSSELLSRLRITSRFSFQLYIDALVLSNRSHPVGLVSFGIYLALMTTRLPLLISNADDKQAEEIPVFHDDWEEAIPLCKGIKWRPPLLFLLAVVGDTILMDPSFEEEQVSYLGLVIGWSSSSNTTTSFYSLDLDSTESKSIAPSVLAQAYKAVSSCGKEVIDTLNSVVHYDENKHLFIELM